MSIKKNITKLIGMTVILYISFNYLFILFVQAYGQPAYITSGSAYFIKNKNSGRYLDVSGGADVDGTNVQQWAFNGTNSQKWKVDYMGNGLYKISPLCSTTGKALDVYPGDNTEGGNIDIYTDLGYDDMRFAIVNNDDGYTYRILSQCSNLSKAVTVSGASCQGGANVIQYTYNATRNDEWIFEPVSKQVELGRNFAHSLYNAYSYTFPYLGTMGGDCSNFVSQCLIAGGTRHFADNWYVYKKNNTYPEPNNTDQLNYSWSVSDPSPWISAIQFNYYWSSKISTETYTAQYILDNHSEIWNRPMYKGYAMQILKKNLLGQYEGYHTMYVCDYGTYNGYDTYLLTYHSISKLDNPLAAICADPYYNNSSYKFKFFYF